LIDQICSLFFPWCPQCGVKILHERDREVLFYVQSQVADVIRGNVFRNLRTSQVFTISWVTTLSVGSVRGSVAGTYRIRPATGVNLTGSDAAKSFITRRAAGSLRGVRGKRTFFGGIDLIAFFKLQPPVLDFGCELGRRFLGEWVKSDVLPALGMSPSRQLLLRKRAERSLHAQIGTPYLG
jgi:hypothetical protein